jgi:hypothetical protein
LEGQLWSENLTAKLFCNVEFWFKRLAQLIEPQPAFERRVAVVGSLLPPPRPTGLPLAHPEFDEVIATFPPEYPF